MKLSLTTLFSMLTMLCSGGELWRIPNTALTVFTNQFSSNVTANITLTNTFDTYKVSSSTFVIALSALGTNDMTNIVDRTVDGTYWVPVATNNVGTNNAVVPANFELTATGKWYQYRFRSTIQGTNATVTIDHIGQ